MLYDNLCATLHDNLCDLKNQCKAENCEKVLN